MGAVRLARLSNAINPINFIALVDAEQRQEVPQLPFCDRTWCTVENRVRQHACIIAVCILQPALEQSWKINGIVTASLVALSLSLSLSLSDSCLPYFRVFNMYDSTMYYT